MCTDIGIFLKELTPTPVRVTSLTLTGLQAPAGFCVRSGGGIPPSVGNLGALSLRPSPDRTRPTT